jgi:2-keto-4-pentenoate hydratase/2-oxohepta-3-ene-1,7-dioic acid hydratase in catechol pathway
LRRGGRSAERALPNLDHADERTGTTLPIALERPGKIICVGLNYRDHAAESNLALPARPLLFAKWQSALVGPSDPIVVPEISNQVDYEAELGVVIGTRTRNVAVRDALGTVAGYICVNDVSARDVQMGDGQWTRGKSFDSFCPVGPSVVAASEVPDPQALRIRCLVNGEALQDSSTAEMVFSVAEIIAFVSEAITLEPGDLIATGTPAGVGMARTPQVFLRPGDEVTVEIEGVGTLSNPVIGAP